MAEEDLSLDDPKKESENEDGESKDGKKKLIIIAAAAAVLLIGGAAAAYFLLMGGSDEAINPITEPGVTQVGDATDEVAKSAEIVPPPPKGDAIYISVREPFLVNIKSGKKTRMMQIKIQFMVRSKEAEDAINQHMPLIRNNMLDFFSTADAKEVSTREGRDALKEGALKTAQKVVKEQAGFDAIEMVLFTGFVVQ